jgi:hypothetical protein
MMAPNKLITFALLLLPSLLHAQVKDSSDAVVNTKRLRVFGLGSGVVYTGSLIGLSQLWYNNSEQQSFHFFNDNAEWKQVDKIGHFYTSFYISAATSRALRWSNIKQSRADLIGSLTGFLTMAPIEILDGFSPDYGASAGDLLANAGGAALYLAQSALWNEVRIWPKFSYHDTRYSSIRPEVLGDTWSSKLLKDYNGQTHWLSVDVDKFMAFPRWLNIAVGYGADQMVHARDYENEMNGYRSYRQYYLSIDFDLTAIRTKSKALKTVIFFVNMIKIPAPTVEFSQKGMKVHAFYF